MLCALLCVYILKNIYISMNIDLRLCHLWGILLTALLCSVCARVCVIKKSFGPQVVSHAVHSCGCTNNTKPISPCACAANHYEHNPVTSHITCLLCGLWCTQTAPATVPTQIHYRIKADSGLIRSFRNTTIFNLHFILISFHTSVYVHIFWLTSLLWGSTVV